jgi:hypothetical protein
MRSSAPRTPASMYGIPREIVDELEWRVTLLAREQVQA